MTLTKKLMGIFSASLAAGFLLIAILAVWQMRSQSTAVAVDNYEKQMDSIAYAFSEIGSREDFADMGDIAAEAYLKYQFRKCYQDGYALLKGEEAIVNLTDYEILSPALLKEPYLIQHPGKKTVLLMKREIPQFPGYDVLAALDITPYQQEIRSSAVFLALACGLVWLLTGAVVFLLTHRALKSLRRLTKAAVRIGEGGLNERVPVESRDEIGIFAAAFNQMTEKVEKQVEDLHLLLGALAHEIKTPMTAVIGYSDSLLHVKLTKEQQARALEQIHHAGLRLERLSSKMLSFLGAYENNEIHFERLDAAELFREVVKETEPLWGEKQLTIEIAMNSPEPHGNRGHFEIYGDRELLFAMFYNLVHNGIKASEPGGKIWLKAGDGVLSVRDEGCGIPEKDLPHVAEAFYMGDKSRSRSEGGSGLGLALCDRIAILHGMRMEIKSSFAGNGEGHVNGGTEVLLYLSDEADKNRT